jgi:hypothetical protein
MKRIPEIIGSLALLVLAVCLFTASSRKATTPNEDDKAYREAFHRNYKMFTVEIPEKIDFAGEPAPVLDFHVRESLDKELTINSYWHSNTILMFKRAYRWKPVIDPILKAQGVPEDMFYLCMIESALENVVSPAGASGFWQFMKTTGTSYGLEINADVDERYNLEKVTEAACKLLKNAYARYNSWTLAAASYNMGQDGLSSVMAQQKTNSYYDLQLNKETQRYIYRILAVKVIFQNPVKYGLYLRKKDLYPPLITKRITIDTTISNIADFCKQQGVSYRVFKELNPWILKNTLPNASGKKYEISLPQDGVIDYPHLMIDEQWSPVLFNDTLKVQDIK